MPGSLYVVSTPIGNLDDITLRALKVLKRVTTIAAEDTRRTATLLRHFGITTSLTSLHEHNERRKLPGLLAALARGEDIALVSDAGTPLISDPGQQLVLAATEQGFPVVPIPGPSAVLAALAVSGLPVDAFVFLGFPPTRPQRRTAWLATLAAEPRTVVFFEAPHRISRTLAEISAILVNRPIIVCRELTKLHEEIIHSTSQEILATLPKEKGEFTVVVGPQPLSKTPQEGVSDQEITHIFYQLTNSVGSPRRAAITETAKRFGLSTQSVYAAVERSKKKGSCPFSGT